MNLETEPTKPTQPTQPTKEEPARPLSALPGPRPWPLIGNLLELDTKRLHLQLEAWARVYGATYVVHFGRMPLLVLSDVALMQPILRDRPKGFRRLSMVQKIIDEISPGGVFSAEGEAWSRQRRLVMAAFGASHLREGHAAIAAITRRLARAWQRAAELGAPVDAQSDLMRFTVDVTCVVGFGTDLNTLEDGSHPLRRHLEGVFSGINRRVNAPFPSWRYVRLPADRALDRSVAEVKRVILDLVRAARVALDADPARAAAPQNLLEAMLAARDGDDARARLSDQEVFGNVFTLLLAGEDTTANTLAWMLYFLAKHPEVQARLQAEVDAQLGDADVPASPEDAAKLRYLAAITHETLRLKSVAPLLFLEPTADATISGVRVPSGSPLVLLTRAAALDDASFHAAASFDPERWIGPAVPGRAHDPRAALAFGGGPRVCPGRALALLECAMVGAMVAKSFTVSLADPAAIVSERLDFTMRPEGLRVRFTPRARP